MHWIFLFRQNNFIVLLLIMKPTNTLSIIFVVLCNSVFARPMQELPPNFKFDDPGTLPDDPFMGPQLLPYNTSDCSFPTTDSPGYEFRSCLIECAIDPNCQTLGFNRTEISCACPAQVSDEEKKY